VIARVALVACVLVLVAACSRPESTRWVEQVQSWDGTVFKLEGYAELERSGFPLSVRGRIRFVEYYHRPSGAFWKQSYGYRPLVFDLVDGTPVAIIGVDSDGKCYWHGWPTPGLIALRWNGSGWEETPLTGLPIEKMRSNLMTYLVHSRDPAQDASGLLTLPEKRQRGWTDQPLSQWIAEYGGRCEKVRGLTLDIGPAPVLTGSHGVPTSSGQ